ncbi:hypothetical protein WA158_005533 [Blastocystis sp. Blastoise]
MQDFFIGLVQYILSCVLTPFFLTFELGYELVELLSFKKKTNPSTVLITGATSGIGYALADKYGSLGATLILISRSQTKLEELKKDLEQKGYKVYIHACDVTKKDQMKTIIDQYPEIDLVIANAGVSQGLAGVENSQHLLEDTYRNIFDINVSGVFNTIFPAIENMKKRNQGQVCIISSIAGLGQNALYPAYSSSKIAVNAIGQGLRTELSPYNIKVNVVCPGPVSTKLAKDMVLPNFLMIKPTTCANIIYRGLRNNRIHTTCFTPVYIAAWTLMSLPYDTCRKWLYCVSSYIRKNGFKTGSVEYAFQEEKPKTL